MVLLHLLHDLGGHPEMDPALVVYHQLTRFHACVRGSVWRGAAWGAAPPMRRFGLGGGLLQRLVDVRLDVLDVFQADGQPDVVGRHAGLRLLRLASAAGAWSRPDGSPGSSRRRCSPGATAACTESMNFLPASSPPLMPKPTSPPKPFFRYFAAIA